MSALFTPETPARSGHFPTPAKAPAAATGAPRLDMYAPIHKTLRVYLTDTMTRLGQCDASDDTDLSGTLAQLDALLVMMRSHVEHENKHVHPALESREPGATTRVAGEHDQHLDTIEALIAESVVLSSAQPASRPGLLLRLYRHFALFVAENFEHMHIEETMHNAALWARFSDAELMQINERIVTSLTPAEMAQSMAWMARALNHAELFGMLSGMRLGMPAQVWMGFVRIVRANMPPVRWARLEAALGIVTSAEFAAS